MAWRSSSRLTARCRAMGTDTQTYLHAAHAYPEYPEYHSRSLADLHKESEHKQSKKPTKRKTHSHKQQTDATEQAPIEARQPQYQEY